MTGCVVAGWVVYLTLSHVAYSQAYFLRLANPLASVFGVWVLAAAVPSAPRPGRRMGAVLAGGSLLGAGVVAVGRALTPTLQGNTKDLTAVVTSMAVPLLVAVAAVVAGTLAWALARRRVPALRGWGLGLALAALVLGGPAEGAINGSVRDGIFFVANTAVPEGGSMAGSLDGYRISPGAGAAMAWVNQHTPSDAVFATNRHCVDGRQRPRCLSLAFWVSGLGGRRTVLEGWGYTGEAKTASGPTPFPARLDVNDVVFTDPNPQNMNRLRKLYAASWLVADRSAGPVSPRLAQFAVPRFSSGEITVYELP